MIAGLYEISGIAADFIINFIARGRYIAISAIQQGNPHGDGTYIQIFIVDHIDRFQNIVGIEHIWDSLLIFYSRACRNE